MMVQRWMHQGLWVVFLAAMLAPAAMLRAEADAEVSHRPELIEYVQRPDASFRYEIREEVEVGGNRGYFVRMTSQTWRDMEWQHWVSIIVPQEVAHRDRAILVIGAGTNRAARPRTNSSEAQMLLALATHCKAVVAVVEQVPNQPLINDMYEDALIAYTFEQFMRGRGDDWPLLLPMVKSAVRGMDAVAGVGREQLGLEIDKFIVAGASKRGWTTYLTGAVDDRVIALAPLVFDAVNLRPQMRQQLATYGTYSDRVDDYTERGLQAQMNTEPGLQLGRIVDPWYYRHLLDMPKLILLGTNDPYWTVDASNLYVDDLAGQNLIYYEMNGGHGLGPGILPSMLAFTDAVLNDRPLPDVQWQRLESGELRVTWDTPGATAMLVQATSDTRDFRRATWRRTRLTGNGQCVVQLDEPTEGYVAYYVDIVHPGPLMPYSISTPITVLPQTFPFEDRARQLLEQATSE